MFSPKQETVGHDQSRSGDRETAPLTSESLSQRWHHHGGPLLCLAVAAEVEADAVVGRRGETHLVAARRLDLVLHRAQVELRDELRGGGAERRERESQAGNDGRAQTTSIKNFKKNKTEDKVSRKF